MNKKMMFVPLFTALALAGCSSDDAMNENGNPDVNNGRTAYLSVSIQDAGSLSRGTGNPLPFELGTADEHAVTSADFYFYDENGNYVARGNAWNGGTATQTEGKQSEKNIEFKGNTTVILKGLTGTGYPKYVVTLLNKPSGFAPETTGTTLAKMQTLLSQTAAQDSREGAVTNKKNDKEYFIMSTSSYKDDNRNYYFVTELEDKNFAEDTTNIDKAKLVNIYVERLAAKVRVKINTASNSKLIPVTEKTNTYELSMTLAGEANEGGTGTSDNPVAAETKVYVTFKGWGLNATTRNSYMMKNIDTKWANTTLGFDWNDPTNMRSYWGMSYNYGKETSNDPKYINYFSYNSLTTKLGGVSYCPENTNTSKIVTDEMAKNVTSVLLAATVSADKEGKDSLDLIHYNTVYFTKDAYINYALNALSPKVSICTKEEEKDAVYSQLPASYVQLKNGGNGNVTLELTEEAKNKEYYTKNENGEWTKIEDNSTINETLVAFNKDFKANAYTGGRMYYNIPIEHLNNDGNKIGKDRIDEAVYGVVRNHVYELTINSLSGLGKGVYEPTEEIIPDDPKLQKLYYVGANINILSWKIVNQGVDL